MFKNFICQVTWFLWQLQRFYPVFTLSYTRRFLNTLVVYTLYILWLRSIDNFCCNGKLLTSNEIELHRQIHQIRHAIDDEKYVRRREIRLKIFYVVSTTWTLQRHLLVALRISITYLFVFDANNLYFPNLKQNSIQLCQLIL